MEEIRFMADRNFKSRPPAWRPPPQHLEAEEAYIIGSICQMMAMLKIIEPLVSLLLCHLLTQKVYSPVY